MYGVLAFIGMKDWKDGKPMFNNVGKVATAFPDKKLIFTEGCNEGYDESRINDPKLPERYAKAMINDFNNGTVAWTDWNILLNEYGGPNHVGNFCFAPVHGDTKTGKIFIYKFILLYWSLFKIYPTRRKTSFRWNYIK